MSLSTYADLKAAVAAFLNRANLADKIPYFIQLCETRIWYGDNSGPTPVEPLRIRAMEINATATIGGQSASLPPGYLQSRRFTIGGDPLQELTYVVPDVFWRTYAGGASGKPARFTVEGENFVFGPTPDAAYTANILYYKKFDALSDDGDTNWLLTNAFGVYLNGALAEAFKFARNDSEAVERLAMFAGGINALNQADRADRYSGSPWMAVAEMETP